MRCELASLAGIFLLVTATAGVPKVDAADSAPPPPALSGTYLSPTALAATADGKTLFIAYATANQVAVFDTDRGVVTKNIAVPESPLGLALAADGRRLYVTCAAPESTVVVLDTAQGSIAAKYPAGHTAMSPVLSPDGRVLYICNRFENTVAALDLGNGRELYRVSVPREPVAADVTRDGKYLLVANHLHAGAADQDFVAASVSVIDAASGRVLKEIVLPNGSSLLRGLRVSPDGKLAAVTHQVSRFHLPTTQVERGWVNSNALSLIDLAELRLINTVLLDNIDSGAANPWAVAWTADSRRIVATHAGTHELSVIDAPELLKKLAALPGRLEPGQGRTYGGSGRTAADVPNDLAFLVGVRQRVRLSESDRGPRDVIVSGSRAYLANYFTDTLSVVDVAAERLRATSIRLGAHAAMTVVRKGEQLFNDATICFQGWQSCASCHSSDARVDGLNWDNLNDGIGNPKNGKSLLQAHETSPSMWLSVREDARMAVRAGIRHSMFTVRPEEDAVAMDEYLKSLQPIPSPFLVKGKLSAAAERGKKVFLDDRVGCMDCHSGPYFTDLKSHDVGTRGKYDKPIDKFDTPSLIEIWRTAPFLHDGSVVILQDLFRKLNKSDAHGITSHLKNEEIDDLVAYMLSL